MILGYVLASTSCNDGLFFDGEESSNILCHSCGSCLNYGYAPQSVCVHPSKKYDISYTYDLRELFSERFAIFCRDILNSKETFQEIQTANRSLFYMLPSEILEFDVARRQTRMEKLCGVCGGYESIVGAHPTFLKLNHPIKYGFFRTDIAFGSGKNKFPLIIIGTEWKNILNSQYFRGLEFYEVTD